MAVVKAAFPKGNLYVDLRTEFGTLYEQDLFADLYADRGHPIVGRTLAPSPREVAPHLTVVGCACNDHGGPGLLLLVRSPT